MAKKKHEKKHPNHNALILFAILLIVAAVAMMIHTKANSDQYSIEEESIILDN